MAQIIEYSTESDEVREYIESHIQSGHLNFLFGSGASLPAIPLTGNTEQEINTDLKDGNYIGADQKALDFIEKIEETNQQLLSGSTKTNIVATLKNYSKFLGTVDHILFERKNTLIPRQATIFTTNYDTFFEVASESIASVMLNDGFDRQSVKPAEYAFSPEQYFDRTFRSVASFDRPNELPGFNLIKMHGSLTWKRLDEKTLVYGIDSIPALSVHQRRNPELVKENLNKRAVILPNFMKFGTTVLERIYFDLLRLYSNCLEKENALLIVFGFSFTDEHILDITKRALRNPTAQVIIFAYTKKEASSYGKHFAQQRNVSVITPTGQKRNTFSTLNTILETMIPVTEKNE